MTLTGIVKSTGQSFGRRAVGSVRQFGCLEYAKMAHLPVMPYATDPCVVCGMFARALEAAFAIFSDYRISAVLAHRGLSQIPPSVIRSIAVFVVNFVFGPPPRNVEPSKPAGHIMVAANIDFYVPATIKAASNLSLKMASGSPHKQSAGFAVSQNRPNVLGGQVIARIGAGCFSMLSHSILHRSSWSGAMSGVRSALSPRYCIGSALGGQ